MKRRILKLSMLVASFFTGMLLGAFIKYQYEISSFRPYTWDGEVGGPIIANCYGSDFSKLQMIRAIDYWTIRGHDIAFYEHEPADFICKSDWMEGFIILRKDTSLKTHVLAATKRMTIGITMKGAVINYQAGSFNLELINEHELGHALGYSHVESKGHIMNPIYESMGLDFYVY